LMRREGRLRGGGVRGKKGSERDRLTTHGG
jgi:hypothetical protein